MNLPRSTGLSRSIAGSPEFPPTKSRPRRDEGGEGSESHMSDLRAKAAAKADGGHTCDVQIRLLKPSTRRLRKPNHRTRALAAATLELTLDIGSHNGATFPCRLGSSSLRRERRTSPLVASDRPNPVMLS